MSWQSNRIRAMLDSIASDSLTDIAERLCDLEDEIDSLKGEVAELREENFDLSQKVES